MIPIFKNRAACEGTDTNMWFTDSSAYKEQQLLLKICKGCSARNECLNYALKYNVLGFWAGTSELIRNNLRKKLNIIGKSVIVEWEIRA